MTAADRLAREAAFHDARFGGEMVRDAQDKYYRAIGHGRAAYEARVRALSAGADVLELGSATGDDMARLAGDARSALGIDASAEAVRQARAAVPGARFALGDAEATGLPDEDLDLVFGAGIVHHLDVAAVGAEAARILRPGGRAVFWEPLGHNLAFEAYRRLTPAARTPDEHPLRRADVRTLEAAIGPVSVRLFGLATLACVPLGGGAAGRAARRVLAPLDRALLSVPGLRWQAWYALIDFSRSPR